MNPAPLLFEDDYLTVWNKPAGLPVQPDKTRGPSLLELAGAHCGRPVHLPHRLDRPVSGAVIIAKSAAVMAALSVEFRERRVAKTYLAVVGGEMPEAAGMLVHFLRKREKTNQSTVASRGTPGSEEAVLRYVVRQRSDRYQLVEIELVTGRHHQIRAQLSAVGCPVKGDVKYGARRGNADRSIHLHAWKIALHHPVQKTPLEVVAPLPLDDSLWQFFARGIA